MIKNILADDNPQRIAEVKATLKEALKMQQKGMGPEEIINIFKKKPTKHATGGIIGLNKGGPLTTQALIQLYMSEGMSQEEAEAAASASSNLPWNILTEKAEGGRVPMWMGGPLGKGKDLLIAVLRSY